MFLQERHGSGLRSRGASAASAGTRLEFVRALEPSTFFDEPVLTAARGACKATSEELRVIKNRGPSESVKLPLCQSLVSSRREANWFCLKFRMAAKLRIINLVLYINTRLRSVIFMAWKS